MGRKLLLGTVAGLVLSAGSASARPGDLYVAGNEVSQNADIVRIDPRTGAFQDVAVLPSAGQGDNAAFGPDGLLYVADETRDLVYGVNVATGAVTVLPQSDLYQSPWALDVAPWGEVMLGDYAAATVFRMRPPGGALTLSEGGQLGRLNALAVTPRGRIIVGLLAGGGNPDQLLTVTRNGAQRFLANLTGTPSSGVRGLTVSSDNTIYIARNASIDRLRLGRGGPSLVSNSSEFDGFFDLEVGFNGNLYAVDSASFVIHVVNPRSGARVREFETGMGNPVGIAVQPPRCARRAATIVGTGRRDRIKGSPGSDVIHGLGGNDIIRGKGGNDRICGGRGRDRLLGGKGRDRLLGGLGLDRVRQ